MDNLWERQPKVPDIPLLAARGKVELNEIQRLLSPYYCHRGPQGRARSGL
jgi:hypothetical protein